MTSHPKYIHYNYPTPATPVYPAQTAFYPAKPTYHLARTTTPSLYASAVLATGVIGAVAGGTAALAVNLHRVQDKQISMPQAAIDSLAKGAGAGVATATGIAVARAVGGGSLATLLVMVGAATGVGYMLNAVGKSVVAKTVSTKAEKSK